MVKEDKKRIFNTKKIIGLIIIFFFIGLQFIRPNKNDQKMITSNDFLFYERAPKNIENLFQESCYNCHSNNTNYFWYDNIAPASWYVDKNISNAKEQLNFSNWKTLDFRSKRSILSKMASNIKEDKMPLPEYTMIHSDAKLTKEEKKMLLNWLFSIKIEAQ